MEVKSKENEIEIWNKSELSKKSKTFVDAVYSDCNMIVDPNGFNTRIFGRIVNAVTWVSYVLIAWKVMYWHSDNYEAWGIPPVRGVPGRMPRVLCVV